MSRTTFAPRPTRRAARRRRGGAIARVDAWRRHASRQRWLRVRRAFSRLIGR